MPSKIEFEKKRRLFTMQEAYFPQAEPMLDFIKLHEAYDYFKNNHKGDLPIEVEVFFKYLLCLEKDVTFKNQQVQP